MELMRIVIAGPVGAGKSTFIKTISDIEAVSTERRATDETRLLKQTTTVAMDFGRLQFNSNMVLHLYGTPGQSRFDFMWEMLIHKAHACIVLVPSHRPTEFMYARHIMDFIQQRTNAPMMIGLTHQDLAEARDSESIIMALKQSELQLSCPITVVKPNERRSVALAVIKLLKHCMSQESVEKGSLRSRGSESFASKSGRVLR